MALLRRSMAKNEQQVFGELGFEQTRVLFSSGHGFHPVSRLKILGFLRSLRSSRFP